MVAKASDTKWGWGQFYFVNNKNIFDVSVCRPMRTRRTSKSKFGPTRDEFRGDGGGAGTFYRRVTWRHFMQCRYLDISNVGEVACFPSDLKIDPFPVE